MTSSFKTPPWNAWWDDRATLDARLAAAAAYAVRFGLPPSAFLVPLDEMGPLPRGVERSALVRPHTVYAGQGEAKR